MNKLVIVFFIGSLIFTSNHTVQPSDTIKKAEAIFEELLETYPGISVAIGLGDEIVWKKGFGFADVENNVDVTPDHQFRYYSLSKSITGIALAKLMESKRLDIERSVNYYLTDLPDSYELVKVKHLINHTSGIRHYKKGEWDKISNDHCDNPKEAMTVFLNDKLKSVPGEEHSYSSFGYVLLSRLITVVSGQPFTDYIQSALFAPLDIDNIAIDKSASLRKEVAYYSKWNSSKVKGKMASFVDNSCKFGAGGFVGTAEGLVRLHLALINGNIISADLTEKYYNSIPTTKGKPTNYAFGVGDATSKTGTRYHAHTGSALGANSVLLIYPASNDFDIPLVIVILGNINKDEMNSKIGQIAKLFRHE